MKVTFLFLLLANGLLFLWHSYFVAPQENLPAAVPSNAPALVLLEETGTAVEVPEVPEVAAPTVEEQAENSEFLDNSVPFVSVARRCFTVGPFIEDDALVKVQQVLAEREVSFNVRTLTEPELFGYNVILPPFSSREDAEKMVEILVDKGITDYYIMPDEDIKNAISLGLFREHRFAIRHMAFLEKKGLSPTLHARYFDRSRHWLDYSETKAAIDPAIFISATPESDIQRLARACT
ncbi:MAG: hypothetical protein AAF420_04545 [Pseudomonadota bacterium]